MWQCLPVQHYQSVLSTDSNVVARIKEVPQIMHQYKHPTTLPLNTGLSQCGLLLLTPYAAMSAIVEPLIIMKLYYRDGKLQNDFFLYEKLDIQEHFCINKTV